MLKSWSNHTIGEEDAEGVLRENVAILPLHGRMPIQAESDRDGSQQPKQTIPAKGTAWTRSLNLLERLASRLPFQVAPKTRGRSARELILSAMRNRAMLRLRYEGHFGYLDVEPHGLGRDRVGILLLWCYEIANLQEGEACGGWHLLTVADIVTAYPSGENFSARPWPGESHFDLLIARVDQEAA